MADGIKLEERPARTQSSGSGSFSPGAAAIRQRRQPQHTTASPSPRPAPLPRRRRSSVISFSSVEDLRQSFADEIINPRTGRRRTHVKEEDEVTHWHSTPLAFAILPAVGGLLFKNGSAFVTDILLLGLAAIFMNWSIRLPWDWYYSTQSLRLEADPAIDADDMIVEETADEMAVETGPSPPPTPDMAPTANGVKADEAAETDPTRLKAASDLRVQEIFALTSTFVAPVLAAYLLHVIRAQLHGPSTSLVSDYNLSVFLLAAEIRPIRQVARLIGSRTLHLQRTVTGREDPYAAATESQNQAEDIDARIAELEARLSDSMVVPQDTDLAQKTDMSDLSVELRKRYEPRLEGLERAVRRYEKRSTTMAIATEQRLQSLETRLQEALSLAAVAAQYSQSRGLVSSTLETSSKVIAFPMRVGWRLATWPLTLVDELYSRLKTLLLGPVPPKASKRAYVRGDGSGTDGKPRDKPSLRKLVR